MGKILLPEVASGSLEDRQLAPGVDSAGYQVLRYQDADGNEYEARFQKPYWEYAGIWIASRDGGGNYFLTVSSTLLNESTVTPSFAYDGGSGTFRWDVSTSPYQALAVAVITFSVSGVVGNATHAEVAAMIADRTGSYIRFNPTSLNLANGESVVFNINFKQYLSAS